MPGSSPDGGIRSRSSTSCAAAAGCCGGSGVPNMDAGTGCAWSPPLGPRLPGLPLASAAEYGGGRDAATSRSDDAAAAAAAAAVSRLATTRRGGASARHGCSWSGAAAPTAPRASRAASSSRSVSM